MRKTLRRFALCLALTAVAALAQTALTFEVASIKPAAPLDMMKVAVHSSLTTRTAAIRATSGRKRSGASTAC